MKKRCLRSLILFKKSNKEFGNKTRIVLNINKDYREGDENGNEISILCFYKTRSTKSESNLTCWGFTLKETLDAVKRQLRIELMINE